VFNGFNPLGGVLHWQMLPVITPFSLYSRILSYLPPDAANAVDRRATAARAQTRVLGARGVDASRLLAALRGG